MSHATPTPRHLGALLALALGAILLLGAASVGERAAPAGVAGQREPAAVLEQRPVASVSLRNAAGREVGAAVLTEDGAGVHVVLQVEGLRPGEHGIHFHEVGRCERPDFASAGGHFNPSRHQHGLSNPLGPHEGDLPNLVADAHGTAVYTATAPLVTLGLGNPAVSLFDADGSALVIHAGPDDQRTSPAGNSGDRVVCGVVRRAA
jgi:Cu-Zn family superoxide dismutase